LIAATSPEIYNTNVPLHPRGHQDASDPDLELPNKLHLLQTAEGKLLKDQPIFFVLPA
jgi:hypothetical protein